MAKSKVQAHTCPYNPAERGHSKLYMRRPGQKSSHSGKQSRDKVASICGHSAKQEAELQVSAREAFAASGATRRKANGSWYGSY